MRGTGHAPRDPQARLEEALGLASAIDLDICGGEIATVRTVRPATLIGSGKLAELKDSIEAEEIDLVIVDSALSPVQQRNLETAWSCKVIDRTGLILEIFGERAATREGVLQVELAALSYQRSRLVRSWTHLERQRGGLGFIGGPGESQIELDRRRIDERITQIRNQLDDVKRTRALHRAARKQVPFPIVALVGYTNAGKSTLFNRLTGAGVVAADKLFATLDPTMRLIRLPSGRQAILSDTVGFITDLPTDLIAAFRATLEEVLAADLLLHVRDIRHPETDEQAQDVHQVLGMLGIDDARRENDMLEAWNKTDLLAEDDLNGLLAEASRRTAVCPCSAIKGDGIDDLLAEIDRRLAERDDVLALCLRHDQGAILSWLHRQGRIVERRDDTDGVHVRVALTEDQKARLLEKLDE